MNQGKGKLGKNIWIMGVVSFLNDASTEMINPILPIFITSVLGAPASVVGLIDGISDAASNLLMSVVGIESDRKQKRKPFVIGGYALSTLSKIFYAVSYSWPLVLLGRVINRAGKGVRTTARDALIVESTDKAERGRSFGFHRMMDSAGAIFGPLLSLGLLQLLNQNYRAMFFWAFVPSAVATLLLFFLYEKRKEPMGKDGIHFEWQKTNNSFRIFLVISLIFALASSSYSFLVLRAQELGMAISSTVTVYVLFNLVNTLFSMPAGNLADRIGPKKVLFLGYILFSIVYLAFGITKSANSIWLLFPLYGVYLAMTDGVSKAYISRLVPHEIAASAFGIYQTFLGFTTFLSSFLAGIIWTSYGSSYAFYFSSFLGLLTAGLFFALSRYIKVMQNPIQSS